MLNTWCCRQGPFGVARRGLRRHGDQASRARRVDPRGAARGAEGREEDRRQEGAGQEGCGQAGRCTIGDVAGRRRTSAGAGRSSRRSASRGGRCAVGARRGCARSRRRGQRLNRSPPSPPPRRPPPCHRLRPSRHRHPWPAAGPVPQRSSRRLHRARGRRAHSRTGTCPGRARRPPPRPRRHRRARRPICRRASSRRAPRRRLSRVISSARPTAGGRPPRVAPPPAGTEARAPRPESAPTLAGDPRPSVRSPRAARHPAAARPPAVAEWQAHPAAARLARPTTSRTGGGPGAARAPGASRLVLPAAPVAPRPGGGGRRGPGGPGGGPGGVPAVAAARPSGQRRPPVVPAVGVVVATRTICSRSSPPTPRPTRPFPRASSSSSVACRLRSSLRS